MTGPDHYREGERLLAESEESSAHFRPDQCRALAEQANAHFAAALVACLAAHQHPESTSWAGVIDQ